MRSIAVLAAVYLVGAKLGLKLAVVNSYATAVWPAAGIALAALLLKGYKLWPGVFLGAFLANVTTGNGSATPTILASLGIATGNTLEALIGAYLVNRFSRGVRTFDRARDVFRFASLAALASTTVSATFGIAALLLSGLVKPAEASNSWTTWWIGNAVGDLVVAPAVILSATDWRLRWNRARALEGILVLLALIVLALIAFTTVLPPEPADAGMAFLCIPALLWSAFRFGPRETAGALLFVSGVAIWGWINGMIGGPNAPAYTLLELQAYLGVTAVTTLAVAAEVSQRRRHERELQRQATELTRLAAIVESSDDAIIGMTLGGSIVSWNTGAERIFGYTAAEVIGRPISILAVAENDQEMPALIAGIRRGEKLHHYETKRRRKNGAVIDVSVGLSPVRSDTGDIVGASTVGRDITERKRLEEEIRQAQKLESIGVLAGGVAHDFNNLLVGILGNASLALEFLPPPHPTRELLQDVVSASQASAALVRQLLTYAGKGHFTVEPVRLPEIVREISRLAQASIPKSVELRFDLDDDAPPTPGDRSKIHQLIMNLIINAGEAIGDHPGVIRIVVGTRRIETADAGVSPGRYVVLEVQDTGCGMDEETRSRIFDPFFTTKFTGRGLGLAAVHGIVRSHKGSINVQSAPGLGTTFEVLLPAMEGAAVAPEAAASAVLSREGGTILVIDDEDLVRRTARVALEHHGYRVMVAETASEGVDLFRGSASEIALVLLDVNMPGMNGEEAVGLFTSIRPDIPVLISSGYNEGLAARRFAGQRVAGFIPKPYTSRQLAEKIDRVLAASGRDR